MVRCEPGATRTLAVGLAALGAKLEDGASVAVNGVCLTAVAIDDDGVAVFDIVRETAEQTNLGGLKDGDSVNVERSLRFGDEIGGHVLSGHIACAVPVLDVAASEGHRVLTVSVPDRWLPYLMPKGFVALNGASLTIQELDRGRGALDVSLIPETLARTNLEQVAAGDRLNLEVDAQTQAVVETVRSLLPDLLASAGGP